MADRKLIYLDNAATTFPKPREVLRTMVESYAAMGVSPGRGSYDLSVEAEDRVMQARCQVCTFLGGSSPERVIFSYNATDALNTVIQGLIIPGAHVVSSHLEHNAVLRPLHFFKEQGTIKLDLVPFSPDGVVDPEDIARAITPDTRFVYLTHASNVIGTIQPAEQIGAVCRDRGVPFILDVTQTAGLIPIRMEEWGVSACAFTGHKSLLGPTGIGGLILSPSLDVRTTRFGGTGKDSSKLVHSQAYPFRLEAGTINILGVFGLSAGLDYLDKRGMKRIFAKEHGLAVRLREGLKKLNRVHMYGPENLDRCLPIILFNVEGMDPEDVAAILDGDFEIAARAGLHCAPLAHEDLGTGAKGAVRFSLGPFNTTIQVDEALAAVVAIAAG